MSDALSADDFMPSLDEARALGLSLKARVWWRAGLELDLMEREPTDQRRLAAIVMRGRVLRRRRLAYRADISSVEAQSVPHPVPSLPTGYLSSTTTIVTDVSSEARPCGQCWGKRLRCDRCYGRGSRQIPDAATNELRRVGCKKCSATGVMTCGDCAGEGRVLDARCVQIIDEVVTLAYPYVPTMSFSVEEKVTKVLEDELETNDPAPTCLQVDLARRKSGGPYRQATSEPEFRGWTYGDALAQARTVLTGTRGEQPILEEIEIHARPILWLRYEAWGVRREVALFYDLWGQLHAMVGDGGL